MQEYAAGMVEAFWGARTRYKNTERRLAGEAASDMRAPISLPVCPRPGSQRPSASFRLRARHCQRGRRGDDSTAAGHTG